MTKSHYDDLPEAVKQPISYEDFLNMFNGNVEAALQNAVSNMNFRAGMLAGMASVADELEEKFELARKYQREIDAVILDQKGMGNLGSALRARPLDIVNLR